MPGQEEVWLGLAGDLCSPGVPCDHYTTRIGGAPAFPGAAAPWSTSSDGPKCRVCGCPLSLVLQAYAPLPDLPDRVLLLLGCTKAGCGKSSGCWQAIRCQLAPQCTQEQQTHPAQPKEAVQQVATAPGPPSTALQAAAAAPPAPAQGTGFDLGAGDWGFGASDSGGLAGWGDAQPTVGSCSSAFDFSDLTSSLAATVQQQHQHQQREAQRKREQKKQQQAEAAAAAAAAAGEQGAAASAASSQGSAGPQLPEFYLLAELEPDASGSKAIPKQELQHVQQLLQAYEAAEGACAGAPAPAATSSSSSQRPAPAAAAAGSTGGEEGDGGVSWAGEEYEPDSVQCMQRSYLKFMKRLARQPQQCARYSHDGPLLWPKKQAPQPAPCPSCGGPRVFEVQLMPGLSQMVLEAAEMAAESGMPVNADVVNAVGNWDWCTVAVFTCQASCSASSEQTDGIACYTAEEEVLLVTEAECETQHTSQAGAAGPGPAAEGGQPGGQQQDDEEEDDDGFVGSD